VVRWTPARISAAFVTLLWSVVEVGHAAVGPNPTADDYLVSTPQIKDPFRPLAGAGIAADHISLHAAVVTVADPLETHLGRAFDIQVSSLIRAFHARNYVLDGYAFTWDPKLAGDPKQGIRIPPQGTKVYDSGQRTRPSVLLFRDDAWRRATNADTEANAAQVRYVVLFLVGESPTFGVQPDAFRQAARCAAALNGWADRKDAFASDETQAPGSLEELNGSCSDLYGTLAQPGSASARKLEIIGPSFSGSMESLALVLGRFMKRSIGCDGARPSVCAGSQIAIRVTSPSASVRSNDRVGDWARLIGGMPGDAQPISYSTLAYSLEDQLYTLCNSPSFPGNDAKAGKTAEHAQDDSNSGTGGSRHGEDRILILAEESTFGGGVSEVMEKPEFAGCRKRMRVAQFPQNIAAIRAERWRLDERASAQVREALQVGSRLLRLDLSQFDESIDRPGAYHPALSSRSDELMLYRLFDAQRVWVKPSIVAVVATDVRDRLFLLNEIRKNLPTALPVLMEMDFLTAHPDYRSIARGSVVIPNGEALVIIDSDRRVVNECRGKDINPPCQYLAFPADYAANLFRATIGMIETFDEGNQSLTRIAATSDWRVLTRPVMREALVATLAGFQGIEKGQSDRLHPGIFLAAESRIDLGKPFYVGLAVLAVFILACSFWLGYHGRTHLAMVSPLRNPNPLRGVTESDAGLPQARARHDVSSRNAAKDVSLDGSGTRTHWWLCSLLGLAGLGMLVLACVRIPAAFAWPPSARTFEFAHGRDMVALAGLAALYAAMAIVGAWRLRLWQRRYGLYRCPGNVADPDRNERDRQPQEGNSWIGVTGALVVLLVLAVSAFITRGLVHSVDSPWPSLLMSLLLLPAGAWFLGQFRTQAQRWAQLALLLGRTIDVVAANTGRATDHNERSWPNPMALGELPQSPLSLQFRARDLKLFERSDYDGEWERDTCRMLAGEWPFRDGRDPAFKNWQARLVAEMRYAAVAVRSAAWCGIIAPTTVLIGMNVYPPHEERLLTVMATAMIVIGFLLMMYQALRLERHPLLSRMFTQHGDEMSLGGAVSALWPKFIAAAAILVPVLFPDFMAWVQTVIRSINSLQ
jgi:hypothetical protein